MTKSKSKNCKLWSINEDDSLQNDADLRKVQPEFISLAEEVKNAYLNKLSSFIHSLYLTGSISRGMAIPGVSDLDAFAVLKEGAEIDDHLDLSKIKAALLEKHSEVTDIQMEVWKWENLFGPPKECLSELRVILKLNSVCFHGEDLWNKILPIKPDIALANTEVIQLKADIENVIEEITKDPRSQNVIFWCKRVMKNLIRAGFYMIIPKEKIFTRDLSLCIDYFLKHSPEMKEIKVCKHYLDHPISEAKQLEHFLKFGFGVKLLSETEKWLDIHNPERHPFLKRT